MTSLGLNFGNLILRVVGDGHLFLGGLMVMIMSIILGMGVPGVAAYVIVYVMAVPVLRGVGATEMAANMFCLIYACLSNITPPVAMSSYVAAGIADSNADQDLADRHEAGRRGLHPAVLLHSITRFCSTAARRAWHPAKPSCFNDGGRSRRARDCGGLSGLPMQKYNVSATMLRLVTPRDAGRGRLARFVNPTLLTDAAALALIAAEVVIDRAVLPRSSAGCR